MKGPIISFIVVGLISFGLGIGYGWKTNLPPNGGWPNEEIKTGVPPTPTQKALGVILEKKPAEIDQVDTATLNWACLGGLPGAENIDLDAARMRITKLADRVKASAQATLEQARKKDKTVQDSPQLRIAVLSYILQQDYKNAHFADQYDPDHAAQVDWGKERAEDLLFQSTLNNRNDPVFSNPVLFVAVGQVLKWPIKLASIPGRLCAVWDDGKTKFFIVPSADGIETLTEDELRKSYPFSDKEIEDQNLYHEYTQPEALAAFLQARGNVLEHMGLLQHATLAYAAAHRFAPDTLLFTEYLASAIDTRMRTHNLDLKVMDQTNADRFNLTPHPQPKEMQP